MSGDALSWYTGRIPSQVCSFEMISASSSASLRVRASDGSVRDVSAPHITSRAPRLSRTKPDVFMYGATCSAMRSRSETRSLATRRLVDCTTGSAAHRRLVVTHRLTRGSSDLTSSSRPYLLFLNDLQGSFRVSSCRCRLGTRRDRRPIAAVSEPYPYIFAQTHRRPPPIATTRIVLYPHLVIRSSKRRRPQARGPEDS